VGNVGLAGHSMPTPTGDMKEISVVQQESNDEWSTT